jgi:hypothetical protein
MYREYENIDKLYRITLEPTDVWSRYWGKRGMCIYVSSPSEEQAEDRVLGCLKSGLKIKKISKLGTAMGGDMWSNGKEK